jgi:hypothetical protein
MNPTEMLELSRAAATLAQQIQIFESGERPLPGEMRQFIDRYALRYPTVSILQRVDLKPTTTYPGWVGSVGYIVFVPQLGQNTCMVQHFHEMVYFTDTFREIDSGSGPSESHAEPTQSDLGKARAGWDDLTTCHGWRVYARNAVGAPCA